MNDYNRDPTATWRLRSLLLLCLLAACSHLPARVGRPRIEVVNGTLVDFGCVKPGIQRRMVAITNTGTDTLRILEIKHSDGGMNGWPVDRNALAPGDTAHMDLQWQMTSARNGPYTRSGYIRSNDPANPMVMMRVMAEVEK